MREPVDLIHSSYYTMSNYLLGILGMLVLFPITIRLARKNKRNEEKGKQNGWVFDIVFFIVVITFICFWWPFLLIWFLIDSQSLRKILEK